MGIYVEVLIHSPLEAVWDRTQNPALHERWDLRFTHIEYLPRPDTSKPQCFRYTTQIGFGLRISGEGESLATRVTNGVSTSALKFWSDDPKSLIATGSGYWKYSQHDGGTRFLTWYDYQTRFSVFGSIFDKLIFRPLMGWATAWSFDSLRLWIEKGIDPAVSRQHSLIHALVRGGIAFIWFYHGLVPKLLTMNRDELAMGLNSGLSAEVAPLALTLFGLAEIMLAFSFLVLWRKRWMFILNIILMIIATVSVAATSPGYLTAAFNPITLNLSMILLAIIGYIVSSDLPSARNCLRKQPKGSE